VGLPMGEHISGSSLVYTLGGTPLGNQPRKTPFEPHMLDLLCGKSLGNSPWGNHLRGPTSVNPFRSTRTGEPLMGTPHGEPPSGNPPRGTHIVGHTSGEFPLKTTL
jgi:hypothetical protein